MDFELANWQMTKSTHPWKIAVNKVSCSRVLLGFIQSPVRFKKSTVALKINIITNKICEWSSGWQMKRTGQPDTTIRTAKATQSKISIQPNARYYIQKTKSESQRPWNTVWGTVRQETAQHFPAQCHMFNLLKIKAERPLSYGITSSLQQEKLSDIKGPFNLAKKRLLEAIVGN